MRASGNNKKYRWFTVMAAVICIGLAFWLLCTRRRQPETASVLDTDEAAVFSVCHDGWRFAAENGTVVQHEDDDCRQYIVDIKNQFYALSQITVNFENAEEASEILVLDENLSVLSRDTVENGSAEYTVSDEMAYLCFSCRNGTDELVRLAGRLTEDGADARKRETVCLEEFTGKSISVLGDSVSAYTGCIPPEYHMQYPAEDVLLRDMWWFRLAKKFGMDICAVNACAGSGVTEYAWASEGTENIDMQSRIEALRTPEKTPDLIFIWIGANDAMGGAPRELIYDNYQSMISDIRKTYPESEIYVCTYYNTSDGEIWLNEDIREIAGAMGVNVIDAENCGIEKANQGSYLLSDGIHPNAEGMHLISAWMGEEFV